MRTDGRPRALADRFTIDARDRIASSTPVVTDLSTPITRSGERDPPPSDRRKMERIDWPTLLKRIHNIDVLACPRCAATMCVLAVVQNREEARRYLEHVGIAARDTVPQRAWDPVPIDTLPPDDWVA